MSLLSKASVRQHANRAALRYDARAAFLHHEVLMRLLSRLDYIKLLPTRILDLGARSGESSERLRKRYPKAEVISCDLSEGLLQRYHRRWYQKKPRRVCLDYEALPFQDQQFDLVFSNLALHWTNHGKMMMRECFRVLKPRGLFLFTTLGPDTLKELRACTQTRAPHLHHFVDMHNLGDLLAKQHFLDPVMDMEYLQLRYEKFSALLHDLKTMGASNARLDRHRGLLGRTYWRSVEQDYQAKWQLMDGALPATIEVIYGHAWLPEHFHAHMNEDGEVYVPISILKQPRV